MPRQKAKGNGNAVKRINYHLDEVKSDLVQNYHDLKAESKIITPQLIKARYLGEDKKIYSVKDIFKYYDDKMRTKLAPKTLSHYCTSQKYILSYISEEYHKPDIMRTFLSRCKFEIKCFHISSFRDRVRKIENLKVVK